MKWTWRDRSRKSRRMPRCSTARRNASARSSAKSQEAGRAEESALALLRICLRVASHSDSLALPGVRRSGAVTPCFFSEILSAVSVEFSGEKLSMAIDGNGSAVAGGGVVITGASSGIGRECALYLDRRGFRVFAGVRKAADGDALARAASARLTPVILDVTDARSVTESAATVKLALGNA